MTHGWREIAHQGTDGRPLLVVHGNCQAEALRVVCTSALTEVASVRVPPVFEIAPQDVETFHALVRRATYLVTQPIVDDYRGLPLGSRQLEALVDPAATVVKVPVLRWAALHPTQVIVRAAGVGDPPGVPYHDLRTLVAAARGADVVDLSRPGATEVRAVRDITREQLRTRQDHHGTVDALSCFEAAGADATWTINHPQNAVILGVARQALEGLGLPTDVEEPGRVLLSTTTGPVYAETIEALGLEGAPRDGWVHQGQVFGEEDIAALQLKWYREHPQLIEAGLRRHAQTLRALGLVDR